MTVKTGISRLGKSVVTWYFQNQSLASSVEGETKEFDRWVKCLSYQGVVTSGSPKGVMKVQLSIIDDVWTDLAGCAPISIDLETNQDFLMIIPEQSSYAAKIRLAWVAEPGSSGTIDVAQRVLRV